MKSCPSCADALTKNEKKCPECGKNPGGFLGFLSFSNRFWATIVCFIFVVVFSLFEWLTFTFKGFSAGFNLFNAWFKSSDSVFTILLSNSRQFDDHFPIIAILSIALILSLVLMLVSIVLNRSKIAELLAPVGTGIAAIVPVVFIISMAEFNAGLDAEGFDESATTMFPLLVFVVATITCLLTISYLVEGRTGRKINRPKLLKDNIALVVMLLLLLVSTIMSDAFFTMQNIFNLLRQLSPPTIIAIGMMFVIMTGGIDLSVGSVVAVGSVLTATLLSQGYSLIATIGLVILVGAAFGAFNGYLVARRRLAPFVVTLAGMTIARGIAFIISRGMPIQIFNETLIDSARDIPISDSVSIPAFIVWFVILIVIVLVLLQRFTVWGRFVQAVGSNETAVRLSGINSSLYKMSAYILSSALAAVGGIIVASRTRTGSPLAGDMFELDAIAAVVIGGASLAGGSGKVINTLMGVLVLGMIGNIMNLTNVPTYTQQVYKGIIILVAVFLQSWDSRSKDISSSSQV